MSPKFSIQFRRLETERPQREHYESDQEYEQAMAAWSPDLRYYRVRLETQPEVLDSLKRLHIAFESPSFHDGNKPEEAIAIRRICQAVGLALSEKIIGDLNAQPVDAVYAPDE